jgi:hypothetical protein
MAETLDPFIYWVATLQIQSKDEHSQIEYIRFEPKEI